jgi:F420-non-reducing hydrogenase small subunit
MWLKILKNRRNYYMSNESKPKIKMAVYWGAACGGCCVSVLDVHETLFTVVEHADLVFWPIALDTKYADVDAMEDGSIDLTLFNGAVRNSENEHMAKVLRKKSKVLVAYGSCAHTGGIPGLANFSTRDELMRRVYDETESTENPNKVRPQHEYKVPEGTLEIPVFYNDVMTLDQVVDVDYYLPGCPPQTERLVEVFLAIVTNQPLPPKGSTVGVTNLAQCEECTRKKSDLRSVKMIYRPWEVEDDGETCFMDQGVICMGPATNGGCGVRCVKGNAPCRGCYGPLPNVTDMGAKIMSTVGTMIDIENEDEIIKVVDKLEDPAGTFYRYSLPAAKIRRRIK